MKKHIYFVLFCILLSFYFEIFCIFRSNSKWDPDFKIAEIRSSTDSSTQKIYYYESTSQKKEPLLVSLHTWAGDYKQFYNSLASQTKSQNWNFIHPDFRGPNNTQMACCSDLVINDIDDAIDWAIKNLNIDKKNIYVIGVSGGAYATLCMFMKSKHNIKSFSAWNPVTDLIAAYVESRYRNSIYAEDILKCTNSSNNELNIQEAKNRSPMYFKTPVNKLRNSKLKIYTGIHDGFTGSVPITHSINFYNKILKDLEIQDKTKYVSTDDTVFMLANRYFPKSHVAKNNKIEDRVIFYIKNFNNIELIIFDGGHEMLEDYAINHF